MSFYIVSLLNAFTWLVCTLSYSTDFRWVSEIFQLLIILCVVLNIFLLFKKKSKRTFEKASLVLFTCINVAFIIRFVFLD